jgi:hypothetical protein
MRLAYFFVPFSLLALTACTATKHHRTSSDPCHLPYLDGSKYFVASMYAYEGKAAPSEKKWTKRARKKHGAVKLEAPADGFPRNLDVILVLNSYEPVEWQVSPTLAKKTGAVLLTGYHEPRLTGLSDSVPIVRASYDEALANQPICRPLSAIYGENNDQPRHKTTAAVVEGLIGLGLDRIGEAYAPEQMFIPSFQRPYVFLKE